MKDAIDIECNTKKKFCVLQKKVLSFGPNRTVEVPPNSLAEPNFQSVTSMKWKWIVRNYFFKVDKFLFYSIVWQKVSSSEFSLDLILKKLEYLTLFEMLWPNWVK